ncbi:hypothetical protein Tsubulata_006649 [Turnera subulata]|uniref:Pentacotripeptide-repeat region of PRORP domain-containing protein n=1 Tax=Turnera subulata TaxID=218843 RepID=A0A9Q0FMK8_9ROSI|nr:hypothetical protein Tsubulata_006649 [Turnera subulata]
MSSQPLPLVARPTPTPTSPPRNHHHAHYERVYIPSHIYKHPASLLLELCASPRELHQIIPQLIKHGLYNELLPQTKLVSLFCSYGLLPEAARVFDRSPHKIDPVYHSMLKGYARTNSLHDALSFFVRMLADDVSPVVYDFTYLLKLFGDHGALRTGKAIHGQLIKTGFLSNLFAMTAVVNLYAKCKVIDDAYKMFGRMPERDLVSWNTIVSGYAQNGMAKVAIEMVSRMFEEGRQRPDSVTLISVLPAIADMGLLGVGKAVHGYAIRCGYDSVVNVLTAVIDMYCKCGAVGTARLIFDGMDDRSAITWNSMMDGYLQSGNAEEAMVLFDKMMNEGIKPTDVTVMEALHACAALGDLERGKLVHKLADELNLGSNISVELQ